MTYPVSVHAAAGQFEATLAGAPEVCATAATREEALAKLEAAIAKRLDKGELVALEVRRRGLAGLFGKVKLPGNGPGRLFFSNPALTHPQHAQASGLDEFAAQCRP